MDRKAGLSILLVILILGSIIGMSIGARPEIDDNYQDFNPEDLNIPSQFYSGDAEGIVSEMFSEILIASKTTLFDQEQIEQDLISIEGVKRTSIQFNKDDNEEIIVIIKVVIDQSLQDAIIEDIKKLDYLTSEPIETYKQARIEINESVVFKSMNDENKTIEYDFVDYIVDGIVNISTIKKDKLQGQLQASFKGETLEYAVFYEVNNLTSAPALVYDEKELPVLKWNELYRYSAKSNYLNDSDRNIISEKIGQINDLEIINDYSLVYKGLDINYTKEDLNITAIENVLNTEESIEIYFNKDYNLENYSKDKQQLIEKGFREESLFKDFEKQYLIESLEIIEDIENKLKDLNTSLEKTEKQAVFDIEKITIGDYNYTYPQKEYLVWLEYPEDVNQEKINFNVQAYVTREEIMFISLDKKIEE